MVCRPHERPTVHLPDGFGRPTDLAPRRGSEPSVRTFGVGAAHSSFRFSRLSMIESIAFQTKARTLDHLGREQIADCPTAISELWKNSFDAYARSVYLDIFDGSEAVASVVDDGHGMNRREFIEKWLVV